MLSRNLVVRQQFTTYITQKFHPGLVTDFLFYDFHFCLVAKKPFDLPEGKSTTTSRDNVLLWDSLRFSLIVIKWTEHDWFCDHTNWSDPVTWVKASEPTWLIGHSKNLLVRMGVTQRWCWPAHTYNTSTTRTKTSTPSVTWRYPNSQSWCL